MGKPFRDFVSYVIGFVCFIAFVFFGEEIFNILNNKAISLAICFVLVMFLWRAYFRILWIKYCYMGMSKKLKVLWTGIAIIILMSLFPPWKDLRSSRSRRSHYVVAGGYGFLFDPPYRAKSIDVARLGVQILVVALITGGVIVSIKEK